MDNKQKKLDFEIQQQQQFFWCWDAVGTSCALYYAPLSGWTQCQVASTTFAPSEVPTGKCCGDHNNCVFNKIWSLDNPRKQGSFRTTNIANGYEEGAISFEKLMSELDQGRPVAYLLTIRLDSPVTVGIKVLDSFRHFVVVAEYEHNGEDQMVTVHDPHYGTSEMSYEVFTDNYKAEAGGSVNYSFFTSPSINP